MMIMWVPDETKLEVQAHEEAQEWQGFREGWQMDGWWWRMSKHMTWYCPNIHINFTTSRRRSLK
jgi:hypothetical protein